MVRLLNRDPQVVSLRCSHCDVEYRPKLTRGECPVCGTVPEDVDPTLLPNAIDADTRVTGFIIATMALNLVILSVLAVAFL